MANIRYTNELLERCAKQADSFMEMARLFGIKPTGSNTMNLKTRCEQLGVDTSHFLGKSHRAGKPANNKLSSKDILILGDVNSGRTKPSLLRRALLEEEVEYKCSVCELAGEWQGKPLTLQVDHRNGQYWDNRKNNLRFICPNCHTQTETWGNKN